MDPSICYKPTFKTPDPKPAGAASTPNDVAQSLKEAAIRLKKQMETVEPPHPVIEIKGETGCCITVKERGNFLVIYKNSDDVPLYMVGKPVFHHIQFTSLTDCRIFILIKMVRVFFFKCTGCQFSIRAPLIGALEFYKCKSSNVNIRIECTDPSERPIPLVMVEECRNFGIYQSNQELVYVVTLCVDITGNIIDPKTKERKATYKLGKIFWGEQERMLVLLSSTQGFASVANVYALNNIDHHLLVKPLGSDSDLEEDSEGGSVDIFGTTPPVAKSGFLWKPFE